MKKGCYINDSIHGLIKLTEYEKKIVSSMIFNRLHDVYQNSTAYLTFPSNRTKRFEHSLGVMKLCSDMFYHAMLNAEEDTLNKFFITFYKECESIYTKIVRNSTVAELKLGGKTPNLIFKTFLETIDIMEYSSFIPYNINKSNAPIYCLVMQAIRASALLHDIGHPPYSHVVEKALKESYKRLKESYEEKERELTPAEDKFYNILSNIMENENIALHENIGINVSKSLLYSIINGKDIDCEDDDKIKYNLMELILKEMVNNILCEKDSFKDLHRFIASSIDGDRLDYVTRDALNAGLNIGAIDYTRLISDIKLFYINNNFQFAFPAKAINSIEDVILRRFNIYKDIINHHRVIKTDYLIYNIVKKLIEIYFSNCNSETVQQTNTIPFDISGLWYPLQITRTNNEIAESLSQWNDSWLITVLRQTFLSNVDKSIKNKMRELLLNERHFVSLIKRSEDFREIDKKVIQTFSDKIDAVEKIIENFNNNHGESSAKIVEKIKERTKDNDNNRFILTYIDTYADLLFENSEIEGPITKAIQEALTDDNSRDIIIAFKRISLGLAPNVYLYNDSNDPYLLSSVSVIDNTLDNIKYGLPFFYIYVDSVELEKKKVYRAKIGEAIGNTILNEMEKYSQKEEK